MRHRARFGAVAVGPTCLVCLALVWPSAVPAQAAAPTTTPAVATSITPNVWRLPKDAPRPQVRADAAAWLAGQYAGRGLGGEVEYQWLPPRAGAMYGSFRLLRDGRTTFAQALTLGEVDGTLVLRVKHFSADFVGWEEKDKYLEFRLISASADELRFDGLTLRRAPAGGIRLYIAMRPRGSAEGEMREEEMSFERLRP